MKLNASLATFALRPQAEFDIVNAYTSDFASRSVCATTDARSHPPVGEACFTTQDLFNLRCAPDAESMHVPRTGPLSSACPGDPAAFLPFPPGRFEPYRSRTRLFRTMNDVFLVINQLSQTLVAEGRGEALDAEAEDAEPLMAKPAPESPALAEQLM